MSFNTILNDYLSELHSEVLASQSGETTTELSFRTSLDNFFKNVSRSIDTNIVTILEPKNQNKIGRPDWRFHNSDSMGVYGYVEAKGIDTKNEINTATYKKQIDKYLSLGNPVLLTDGIDFILFRPDGEKIKYTACSKPVDWENVNPDFELESLFLSFFGQIGHRIISEHQLVSEVAKRTKLLTEEINEFLNLEEDEAANQVELHTIRLLKNLKEVAATSHDKTLEDDLNFSDFISQVLTFGLLYAHRVIDFNTASPSEKYERIHRFWFSVIDDEYTEELLPFKMLVRGLESELNSDLSRLGVWYDDLRRLLSHIQFSNKQIETPDFHELYEAFLTKYDPDTRFDYGAFYTPRVLAFYTARLANTIIRKTMPGMKINAPGNKIIDPCCGTGTFLEAILDIFTPSDSVDLIGFEILPAPYALAHYRMSIISRTYPKNVKIKLTNTLSDTLFETNLESNNHQSFDNLLVKEQKEAYNLATPPLTLIIGNPPSSDSTFQIENEGKIIKELINDFRPEETGRTARQNTQKQLSNEFVKFLRWTADRSLKSSPSLFILIIPSSFAKSPTYKFARKFLIEKFNEIWVLDFDGDLRTGTGSVNLFKTRQGRQILAAISVKENQSNALLNYQSISHLSKREKVDFFSQTTIDLNEWKRLEVDTDDFSLKPKTKFDKKLYNSFWPITDADDKGIFLRHCSGVKLAPTHLLVHASAGQLKRRSKFIADTNNNFDTIKARWYNGQRKIPSQTKITEGVRAKLKSAIAANHIAQYSYRPFLAVNVILDNDLLNQLKQLGGGGTRIRPEVRAAYTDNRVFGFIVSPAPEDLDNNLHKFSSFCWNIPDNDLSKRGSARLFCNYFPKYKKKGEWNQESEENINIRLSTLLSSEFNISKTEIASLLTFYCYAILSSNSYLNSFEGALHGVAGNWPKIPITKDKSLFLIISELGKKLAEIEKAEYTIPNIPMPEGELTYYKYDFKKNTINLRDDAGNILKQFPDLDPKVITFKVSGYNVIKEWLKIHSYQYYRRSLQIEKILELETLIAKIHLYIKLVEQLDLKVEKILEGELYVHI